MKRNGCYSMHHSTKIKKITIFQVPFLEGVERNSIVYLQVTSNEHWIATKNPHWSWMGKSATCKVYCYLIILRSDVLWWSSEMRASHTVVTG